MLYNNKLKTNIMQNKREQIIKAISTGKFFTIKFIKKNGMLRELNGRLGVKKHLKVEYLDMIQRLLTILLFLM